MISFWTDARRLRRAVVALALIVGQLAATSVAARSPCVRKQNVETPVAQVAQTADTAVASLQEPVAIERSAPTPQDDPGPDEAAAAAGASCTVLSVGHLPVHEKRLPVETTLRDTAGQQSLPPSISTPPPHHPPRA